MTLSVGLVLTSTLLCALVTGIVFTYAVIVMPGLTKLADKEFIRAFQVTNEVIQNNQPIFMIVWAGSVISVVGNLIVSFMVPYPVETVLVVIAGSVYLQGMQGQTALVHLPLNRSIQTVNVGERDASALRGERFLFETRWICFNWIRSLIGLAVTVAFMVALSLSTP